MSLLIIAHFFLLRAVDRFKRLPGRGIHNPDRSLLTANDWDHPGCYGAVFGAADTSLSSHFSNGKVQDSRRIRRCAHVRATRAIYTITWELSKFTTQPNPWRNRIWSRELPRVTATANHRNRIDPAKSRRNSISAELRRNPLLGCVLLVDASHLIPSGRLVGRATWNDQARRNAFAEGARFDQWGASAS